VQPPTGPRWQRLRRATSHFLLAVSLGIALIWVPIVLAGGFTIEGSLGSTRLQSPLLLLWIGLGLRTWLNGGREGRLRWCHGTIAAGSLVLILTLPLTGHGEEIFWTAVYTNVLAWVFLFPWSDRRLLPPAGVLVPLVLLTAWALVAALLSSDRRYSVKVVRRDHLAFLALFVPAWLAAASPAGARRAQVAFLAALGSTLAYGFFHFGGAGEPYFRSSFDRYNRFGLFLDVTLPLAGAALIGGRSLTGRLVSSALLMLGAAAAVLAKSKGTLLVVPPALLLVGLLERRRLLLPLALAGAAAVAAWFVPGLPLREEVGRYFTATDWLASGYDAPLRFRPDGWRAGRDMVLERPLTGFGPGRDHFQRWFLEHRWREGSEELRHTHNTVLQVAVETGLPGAALVLWLFVALLIAAIRRVRHARTPGERTAAAGFLAGLAALLAHGLVAHLYYPPTGFLLFLAAAAAVGPGLGSGRPGRPPGTAEEP
jgi:O-antigen ligase